MKSIIPTLWFSNQNCEEAVNYYVSIFPNSSIDQIDYYPSEALSHHFKNMDGKVFTTQFTLNGNPMLAMDGEPLFYFNESISFTIVCNDQKEIDYYWEKLSHVKAAESCGWVKDKFGISWQIVPNNMHALTQNDAQIQAMLKMKKINIQTLLDLN